MDTSAVIVLDPRVGRVRYTLAAFRQVSSGHALTPQADLAPARADGTR